MNREDENKIQEFFGALMIMVFMIPAGIATTLSEKPFERTNFKAIRTLGAWLIASLIVRAILPGILELSLRNLTFLKIGLSWLSMNLFLGCLIYGSERAWKKLPYFKENT